MYEFKNYHPVVNFIYFLFVIGFSMFFMHPVCLLVSFFSAHIYFMLMKGAKQTAKRILYTLPLFLAAALINPAFNHAGVTVLTYFPNGNPLTEESIFYGAFAAALLLSVICWFSCFNEVMTSDKYMYLFGKIVPSLSLVFSMTLRFVPAFIKELKEVSNAQRTFGCDVSNGTLISRAKSGLTVLSVMITRALEGAVEAADSMRARGFNTGKRSAYSNYVFTKRDLSLLIFILFSGLYTLVVAMTGYMHFRFFPSVKGAPLTLYGLSGFAAFSLLCLCPVFIELWEDRKWKVLKSKM